VIGIGAVVVASAVAVGAVVAGFVGPRLHRRHPERGQRPPTDASTNGKSPVEAERNAGPSYFASPGA